MCAEVCLFVCFFNFFSILSFFSLVRESFNRVMQNVANEHAILQNNFNATLDQYELQRGPQADPVNAEREPSPPVLNNEEVHEAYVALYDDDEVDANVDVIDLVDYDSDATEPFSIEAFRREEYEQRQEEVRRWQERSVLVSTTTTSSGEREREQQHLNEEQPYYHELRAHHDMLQNIRAQHIREQRRVQQQQLQQSTPPPPPLPQEQPLQQQPRQQQRSFTCAICINNALTENPTVIRCGHCFHYECLIEWLRYSSTCPVCRYNTTIEQCALLR